MLRNWVLLFCVFFVLKSSSQVLINEYSAANYAAYTDNYGEYEDWVELYNPTASPIDLNGWFLTDKTANPTKWSFTSSLIIDLCISNKLLLLWELHLLTNAIPIYISG